MVSCIWDHLKSLFPQKWILALLLLPCLFWRTNVYIKWGLLRKVSVYLKAKQNKQKNPNKSVLCNQTRKSLFGPEKAKKPRNSTKSVHIFFRNFM